MKVPGSFLCLAVQGEALSETFTLGIQDRHKMIAMA